MRSLVAVSLFVALSFNINVALSSTSSCTGTLCSFYPRVHLIKKSIGGGLKIVTPPSPAVALYHSSSKALGAFLPLHIPFQVVPLNEDTSISIPYDLILIDSQHHCLTEGETEQIDMATFGKVALKIDGKDFGITEAASKKRTTVQHIAGEAPQDHTLSIIFPAQPQSQSMQKCSGKIDIMAQSQL